MATSTHSEIISPDIESLSLSTGATEIDTETSKPTTDSEDNTSDTLALARRDRENQGPWECEYSYEGGRDLHRHYTRCKKNPGHKNFIHVDKFSIDDLPEDYRDKELVDYIRAVSDMTVRVTVRYVSDKRPKTIPGTNKPYPGYSVSGQRRVTVGTGWVSSVEVYDTDAGSNCECKDCCNSSTPEMNFAKIYVITATHVVFDDLEAEHTTCHLFFDKGGTPDTCTGVVTLTDMSCGVSSVTEDYCLMEHYTHDLNLARKLKQTFQQMTGFFKQRVIHDKTFSRCNFKLKKDVLDKQPLLFIVSHPHGCSKQISLGYFTSAYMFNNDLVSLFYNTATCPGSSGAQVHFNERFTQLDFTKLGSIVYTVHCGVSDEQHKANFCRSIEGLLPFKLITMGTLYLNTGPWADNFCSVEEQDQNQHYAACQKNPGHGNFFPVDKFRMDHLPPSYRRHDVMNLVKQMSDLTVRVTVNYVSENRPETVLRTDIPYPWSSNRGSRLTRVGTGFIGCVDIRDNLDCGCKECRNSPKPQSPLACINICTATHLVYDKLEAEHTTCQLFYDLGKTSDTCTSTVTLADVHSFDSYTVHDHATIRYYTHDLDIIRRIEKNISQYKETLESLRKPEAFKSTNIKQNGVENAKQKPSLHIVVSHPHGCAKQVSICCCGNPGNDDTEDSQCSHSSAVCPGSSGAPVIDLSWKLVYPCVK